MFEAQVETRVRITLPASADTGMKLIRSQMGDGSERDRVVFSFPIRPPEVVGSEIGFDVGHLAARSSSLFCVPIDCAYE